MTNMGDLMAEVEEELLKQFRALTPEQLAEEARIMNAKREYDALHTAIETEQDEECDEEEEDEDEEEDEKDESDEQEPFEGE
jgi:hypothetical protein